LKIIRSFDIGSEFGPWQVVEKIDRISC
jgi:hypothetical protein